MPLLVRQQDLGEGRNPTCGRRHSEPPAGVQRRSGQAGRPHFQRLRRVRMLHEGQLQARGKAGGGREGGHLLSGVRGELQPLWGPLRGECEAPRYEREAGAQGLRDAAGRPKLDDLPCHQGAAGEGRLGVRKGARVQVRPFGGRRSYLLGVERLVREGAPRGCGGRQQGAGRQERNGRLS